jgi:3-methyladenine DNA glycosylase AlkD
MDVIQKELFKLQDKKYKEFQEKLIPTRDPDTIIGVRTPELRKYAKELFKSNNYQSFLKELPHKYFDENQLHAFIISEFKDFEKCIKKVERFLPFVDNWATCDQLSPKCFKRNSYALLPYIKRWIKSDKTYTVRFAIGMLMAHFLAVIRQVAHNKHQVRTLRGNNCHSAIKKLLAIFHYARITTLRFLKSRTIIKK